MKPEDVYIQRVLERLPSGKLRRLIEAELRGLIADRVEHGATVEEAIRQLGDPRTLAESYVSAVPLVRAPHGRRFAAKLFDLCLLFGLPLTICVTLYVTGAYDTKPPLSPYFFFAMASTAVLASFGLSLYPMITEYRSGQTIGKRLFGLMVVTESGTKISFGQSFLRQMPLFLQITLVDALFALFTEKRQRAFELISKTRVVVAQEALQGHAVPAGSPAQA